MNIVFNKEEKKLLKFIFYILNSNKPDKLSFTWFGDKKTFLKNQQLSIEMISMWLTKQGEK
jgi:hypothetical protein